MSKTWLVGIATVALVTASAARAEDIAGKKILDQGQRQPGEAADHQGAVHSTPRHARERGRPGHERRVGPRLQRDRRLLRRSSPAGRNWEDNGTKWKYKNTTTKNSAQVKDGRLLVKVKTGSHASR